MKIQGPTHSQVNVYKEHAHQSIEKQSYKKQTDRLEISKEAQRLQKGNQNENKRAQYVNQIKQSYENGTYKVQPEKIAQKLMETWSKDK
ncbi:MAG TPA: flagellar biosynthesis anti-sigma factor FlgM [Bacillota bacterium]|nr:flagellar biosynthesis anti-sigma factor FlgM [Bacillota bacterium]